MTRGMRIALLVLSSGISLLAQPLDFSLSAKGPSSVTQGYSLSFAVTGKVIAGVDDMAAITHAASPGIQVEYTSVSKSCCGTSVYRVSQTHTYRAITQAATPLGSHFITLKYKSRTDGTERSVTYPFVVFPVLSLAGAAPLKTAPALSAEIAKWKENAVTFGLRVCEKYDSSLWEGGFWYYDGTRASYQIADATGDARMIECAKKVDAVYRPYVITANGAIPAWRVFPHGLLQTYKRTGDTTAKDAVLALYRNSGFSRPTLNPSVTTEQSREVAFAISTHIAARALGESESPEYKRLVDVAFGYFEQWFVSKQGAIPQPIFVGLLSEALIEHYEATADPRVPHALKLAADGLMPQFDPAKGAIAYVEYSVNPPTSSYPADLNMLVAPLYGWVYRQTGDERYRERGDALLVGSVKGAWLDGGKQFTQTYRWGWKYLEYRQAPSLRERISSQLSGLQSLLAELP
jgi:hypothetical protein